MTLDVFRDPRSVAVVGASDHPAKWGHWLGRGALTGAHRRTVYMVNAKADTVLGQPAYKRLGDLPEVPDLVVLAVPVTDSVVDEAITLGVRGVLDISAGRASSKDVAARVRAAGVRMIGPNCLGLYDGSADLRLAWGTFTGGSLGIVSQSGQLGVEIANLAASLGVGVSRFVSVGDQVDVTVNDVLADLVDHEPTRAVALYAEDFGDGRALIGAIADLWAAGKPTLVLTVGASAAGRETAQSHTGALTAPLDVVDAACRAAGAIRVRTPAELASVAHFVLSTKVNGDRVAILTDSGGQGAIAADIASAADLQVPRLSEELTAEISRWLPERASSRNPVDLAGVGEQDLSVYSRIATALATSGEIDAVLITGYFGSYGVDIPQLCTRELDVVQELAASGGTIVVHSMAADGPTVDALRANGIPVFRDVDTTLVALRGGARAARTEPRKIPEVSRLTGEVGSGYLAARELLADAGVSFPPCAQVDGVVQIPGLQAPYVLKADWLTHKTEVGAVVLGLPDEAAVADAHGQLVARLGAGRYVVEEMDVRPDAIELIIGAHRDASFGPVVMVGAGGVTTELDRDTSVELAPVDIEHALAMVRRLRCAPLLDGWRGRPAVDVQGVAEVIVAVSELIAAREDIAELELNPVRVTADGPLAVDALVVGVKP
ncbi:acetate--CoA ligase family protein [Kibdelosporangium philippinense]|uniref:Acetate--CoA ligase family protein n=1 Tax=Kibdelosporangium philippinense TaxID=211113 RepID=A0ABS8ZFZ8_9PSEU|nr:acetate--CoA ligase family protein [Kibdelosporangium philippinense]MCE7006758.1 acetate--CoA ligase family protein [Kibdelosporangium philippinense]